MPHRQPRHVLWIVLYCFCLSASGDQDHLQLLCPTAFCTVYNFLSNGVKTEHGWRQLVLKYRPITACLLRAGAIGPWISTSKYPQSSIFKSVGLSILTHNDGCSGGIVGWSDGPWPPDLLDGLPCHARLAPFILVIACSIVFATATCLSSPTFAGLCAYVQFWLVHLPRRLKLLQSPFPPI
jgi:hypothetical protein